MYLNFGKIGANIKLLVENYRERSNSYANAKSIADTKEQSTDICSERDYDRW